MKLADPCLEPKRLLRSYIERENQMKKSLNEKCPKIRKSRFLLIVYFASEVISCYFSQCAFKRSNVRIWLGERFFSLARACVFLNVFFQALYCSALRLLILALQKRSRLRTMFWAEPSARVCSQPTPSVYDMIQIWSGKQNQQRSPLKIQFRNRTSANWA